MAQAEVHCSQCLSCICSQLMHPQADSNESIVKISGVSVGFDAKAPPAQRKIAIDKLRALYGTVRGKTEQFWQNRKRYREEHPED